MSSEYLFRLMEWYRDCKNEELKKEAMDYIPILGVEGTVSWLMSFGENI